MINSSPPTPLNINEKIDAPIRMAKIIVDTTAVFSDVSIRNLILTFLFIRAIIKAPKAPMADASVGVAIPANMEPKTERIKITGRANVLIISILLIDFSFE